MDEQIHRLDSWCCLLESSSLPLLEATCIATPAEPAGVDRETVGEEVRPAHSVLTIAAELSKHFRAGQCLGRSTMLELTTTHSITTITVAILARGGGVPRLLL